MFYLLLAIPLLFGVLCGYSLALVPLAIISCPALLFLAWLHYEGKKGTYHGSGGIVFGILGIGAIIFLLGAWITAGIVRLGDLGSLVDFDELRKNASEFAKHLFR